MSTESNLSQSEKELSDLVLEQEIKGSRKVSNYLVASMLSIGGVGFLLASFSSYFGRDLLPLGNPSTLIFVPQGLVMGLYGVAAFLLALYFWRLISIDYGSGVNRFDKNKGVLSLSRRGLLKNIEIGWHPHPEWVDLIAEIKNIFKFINIGVASISSKQS